MRYNRMMKSSNNIFLIGLMGAGKTTIGRALARLTDKKFHDVDHEIETRTGVRIPIVFEIEGEIGFRRREEKAIASLVQQRNIVLATGGGAILSENNRQNLKQHGFVVYLYAHLDDLWARTRYDKNRPLLYTDNPKQQLQALFTARDGLYRETADLVLDTTGQRAQAIASLLLRQLSTDDKNG